MLYLALFAFAAAEPLSSHESALMDAIRANTLRGHVSFLASDLLEGRDTPSRGLDLAAEYIAAQFRRMGVEPAGDDGYFQTAPFVLVKQPMEGFLIRIETSDGKKWESTGDKASALAIAAAEGGNLDVVKISLKEDTPLPEKAAIRGKAVILLLSQQNRELMAKRTAILAMEPAVIVTPGFSMRGGGGRLRPADGPKGSPVPVINTSDSDFSKLVGDLSEGAIAAKISFRIPAPVEEPLKLRNVVAKIPGTDLKDSYVLLTAHYDHIGVSQRGDGDRINNGANDDASGVSSVLAMAEAFRNAPRKPRRTLIFMTYFGEEKGLFGSRYYASHPIFPLKDTVANLNFEHMGRTDDSEGPKVAKITASGFDYTTMGELLMETGKLTGVEAWKHDKNSDAFFARSDNQALADAGIPALTLAVSWIFPDYHRPADHWDKLDYDNLEKVVRMGAVTVSRVADADKGPRWIDTHPKVEKYVEAFRKLHAAPSN